MGIRSKSIICYIALLAWSAQSAATSSNPDDIARLRLARELAMLSRSLDMRQAQYVESAGGGGKNFNSNDGNSFMSKTTYHSYVWDYCQQWVGRSKCKHWIPPYISKHGPTPDHSDLEALVWNEYEKNGGRPQQNGGSGQYAIWNYTTKNGGSILDRQGRLNEKELTNLQLSPGVRKRVEALGEKTASENINYALIGQGQAGAKVKGTMASPEALRFMAARWSTMFRSRLVANLGEQRVNQQGIEFALGENSPTCGSYLQAVQKEQQNLLTGGRRISAQAELDVQTRVNQLQQRYELCEKMRMASNQMVNPQAKGNDIVAGSPDNEKLTEWRTRVNLALVDNVGIDPNSVPHPSDAVITKPEYTNALAKYDAGAETKSYTYRTNAEQLAAYNKNLQSAAAAMKEAVSRDPYIQDQGNEILKNQIAVGSDNLIHLNGLTQSMKQELAPTGFPRTGANNPATGAAPDPSTDLAQSPAQLVVRSVQ